MSKSVTRPAVPVYYFHYQSVAVCRCRASDVVLLLLFLDSLICIVCRSNLVKQNQNIALPKAQMLCFRLSKYSKFRIQVHVSGLHHAELVKRELVVFFRVCDRKRKLRRKIRRASGKDGKGGRTLEPKRRL